MTGHESPSQHRPLVLASAWHVTREHGAGDLLVVAMEKRETQTQEANYLFLVASLGMFLNLLVVVMIFVRRNLRRMTSAFLIHAGFLNFLKAAFCISFGLNLLSGADETKTNQPSDCTLQGSGYIVMVTTSAINMVAMICTEAYTFGEINVGGNSHGTSCCILFGLLVVYITSVILHLGPTLIGGSIVYNPDIGNCAFQLGSIAGYVGNVMWIVIISISFVGMGFFLRKLYREIQMNCPNRVSMLVRHSITISSERCRKASPCTVHEMTQEAMHRAKIFLITAIAFALCWYPLFILILIDINFRVSPKVYQAFSFIAWTEAMVEPIILICFDRNMNLLARFLYCDREHYTASQIAFLLAHNHPPEVQQRDQHEVFSLHNSSHVGHAFHPIDGHTPISGPTPECVDPQSGLYCCNCSASPDENTPLRTTGHLRPLSEFSEPTVAFMSSQELQTIRKQVSPAVDRGSLEMMPCPQALVDDQLRLTVLSEVLRQDEDVQC